jgi:hypothetical protein
MGQVLATAAAEIQAVLAVPPPLQNTNQTLLRSTAAAAAVDHNADNLASDSNNVQATTTVSTQQQQQLQQELEETTETYTPQNGAFSCKFCVCVLLVCTPRVVAGLPISCFPSLSCVCGSVYREWSIIQSIFVARTTLERVWTLLSGTTGKVRRGASGPW